MLTEAAFVLLTRYKQPSSLKAWGLKIAGAQGYKKAIVAVGRKLAVLMHRMWVDGKDFNLEACEEIKLEEQDGRRIA